MAWRESREYPGLWVDEGGNGVAAHAVRVGDRYAWNVTHRDRAVAGGWSGSLDGAKNAAESQLVKTERLHTDEDDRPRSGPGEHWVDPHDRRNGEHVKGHVADDPRRGR